MGNNGEEWKEIFAAAFGVAYSPRQFNSCFGVSPLICEWLWGLLQTTEEIPRMKVLWTLSYLKTGATYSVLSTQFGVTPKTFQEWLWRVIEIWYDTLDEVSSFSK